MIRVRDDDVLISSKGTKNPLTKFKMVHDWICEVPETLIHVPTILVRSVVRIKHLGFMSVASSVAFGKYSSHTAIEPPLLTPISRKVIGSSRKLENKASYNTACGNSPWCLSVWLCQQSSITSRATCLCSPTSTARHST